MRQQEGKEKAFNIQEWFAILDRYAAEELFVFERAQPVAPERIIFEDQYGEEDDRDA